MSEQPTIRTELATHAPGLPYPAPAMPHAVPAGYFEHLPTAILERIRLESDDLPTVLSSLKERNTNRPGWPYQAPAGYFEQTPSTMATNRPHPTTQGSSPVVSLPKRSWFAYAAAAAVLATIFGIGRWYQQRPLPDIEKDPASWVRNEVNQESTEKIEHYINGNLIETTALQDDHKKEIAQLTQDIDEKEILLLLNETALLASATESSVTVQKILN